MRELNLKIGVPILLFLLLMCGPINAAKAAATTNLDLSATGETENAGDAVGNRLKDKLKRGTYFILGIEEKIKNSGEELGILQDNARALEAKINESKVKIDDLKSQLENIDRLVANNKEKIFVIKLQVAKYENEISVLEDDVNAGQNALNTQLEELNKTLVTYYLQANVLLGGVTKEPSLLALLSTDESTGEVLRENEYLYFLQNASQELAHRIIIAQLNLDEKRDELKEKDLDLKRLRDLLEHEQSTLFDSQESRQRLLDETQGRQIIYETLLELSRKEMEQVSEQISRLRENYSFFQEQLDKLKDDPGTYDFALDGSDSEKEIALLGGDAPFIWPVSPNLGLSAFFRDEKYQKALGVPHNAIDIRKVQGSVVKAAASGVITKVADNGYGYSYIIIAHPGKLLTLYGHMSKMLVKEGEIVRQGQAIGLSGGIPGTIGAGWLTTGAHLHFEVFYNWKQVDPLEYLPLEYVPVSSLPKKYVDKLMGEEREKVRRAPTPTLESTLE